MRCLLAANYRKPRTRFHSCRTCRRDADGERRDLVAEQRYLIWKHCREQSDGWKSEQKRIRDEANEKIANAMRNNNNAAKDKYLSAKPKTVIEHCVQELNEDEERPEKARPEKARAAKAVASKTNMGAVQRGDQLAKERPDLAAGGKPPPGSVSGGLF